MICESKLKDGFYWVYFNKKWNMLKYCMDGFYYTNGQYCHDANGCKCKPICPPNSSTIYI